jgi:hypothetical protein
MVRVLAFAFVANLAVMGAGAWHSSEHAPPIPREFEGSGALDPALRFTPEDERMLADDRPATRRSTAARTRPETEDTFKSAGDCCRKVFTR